MKHRKIEKAFTRLISLVLICVMMGSNVLVAKADISYIANGVVQGTQNLYYYWTKNDSGNWDFKIHFSYSYHQPHIDNMLNYSDVTSGLAIDNVVYETGSNSYACFGMSEKTIDANCSSNTEFKIQYYFQYKEEELIRDYRSIYAPVASDDVTFFINDVTYGSSKLDYGFNVKGQQLNFVDYTVNKYNGNSYGCTITYYQNGQPLSEKPVDAGDYGVRYAFYYRNSDTNTNYTLKEGTDSFSILPSGRICEVTVPSTVNYGEDYVVTSTDKYAASPYNKINSTGAELQYFDSNDNLLTEKPTDAGTYRVRAVYPATNNFLTCTSDKKSFSILPIDGTCSIQMDSFVYGEGASVNPVYSSSTNTGVTPVISYSKNVGGTYTDIPSKPSEAGSYRVTVTYPATTNYKECTSSVNFNILTAEGNGTISVADINYGEELIVNTSSSTHENEAEVYFKLADAADSTYTTTKPTLPGSYIAKAVFPENENYNELNATTTFRIRKINGNASVNVSNFRYNATSPKPVLSSDTNGIDNVKIEYKPFGAPDSNYSSVVPTEPGKYNVRAIFPSNNIYNEVVVTNSFEILQAYGNATLSIPNLYYGVQYQVAATHSMKNASTPIYEYKEAGAENSTFSSVKPTEPGTYVAKVTFPANKYYFEYSTTCRFTISYMPAPKYYITGEQGENGYYTSNVTITTEQGYSLCSQKEGRFTESIILNEINDVTKLYFRDVVTGARSDEVLFEPLLIDTVLPITSGQPEEEEQYLNLAELSIKDTNLSSVTVNGEEMEFDGSICNLSLSPEGGIKEFEIIVTDLAGNSRRIFFTLIAEWLQDKVVPMEEEISMETEVVYQLPEEGTWTVQGDSTVYPGGTSFCVTESGRYIFNAE